MAGILSHLVTGSLTLLLEEPITLEISITAIEGKRMRVSLPRALALGTPAKIVSGPSLWLGDVIECRADGSAIVAIAHVLKDIEEMARTADRFLGKAPERYADSLCPTKR